MFQTYPQMAGPHACLFSQTFINIIYTHIIIVKHTPKCQALTPSRRRGLAKNSDNQHPGLFTTDIAENTNFCELLPFRTSP